MQVRRESVISSVDENPILTIVGTFGCHFFVTNMRSVAFRRPGGGSLGSLMASTLNISLISVPSALRISVANRQREGLLSSGNLVQSSLTSGAAGRWLGVVVSAQKS